MRLADFPAAGRIFVDANILIYHLDATSPYQRACSAFLHRIETEAIRAVTSTLVIDEILYALLIHEGSQLLQTDRITTIQHRILNSAPFAKRCYARAAQMIDYLEVLRLHGLSIVEATFDIVKTSLALATEHRLLPRDAIHASTCDALGISHIATRDDHFTRLPSLQVWMP
ncbi:MAG: type II toxin-antitoxin system VapC family toxin [Candidatus Omnitrophota bacterium]|nr:type II toxin-antitoxin system VapC family toxin [Candidatus Omnitrophota bacterium]